MISVLIMPQTIKVGGAKNYKQLGQLYEVEMTIFRGS